MHECIESLVHHDDTPVLQIPTMISFGRARSSARQSTGLLTPAAFAWLACRNPMAEGSNPFEPVNAPPAGGGIDRTRFWRFLLRHDSVEGLR